MTTIKSHRQQGQTLIETALILFLILIILIGIVEFARAWHTKNSMKNAARQGARVAAVTPASLLSPTSFACINPSCPQSNVITNAVCCQPGIPTSTASNTTVTLTCPNTTGECASITSNGTVKVSVASQFEFIVGGSPWPWAKTRTFTENASMRYE